MQLSTIEKKEREEQLKNMNRRGQNPSTHSYSIDPSLKTRKEHSFDEKSYAINDGDLVIEGGGGTISAGGKFGRLIKISRDQST